jgi:hypothetical protein
MNIQSLIIHILLTWYKLPFGKSHHNPRLTIKNEDVAVPSIARAQLVATESAATGLLSEEHTLGTKSWTLATGQISTWTRVAFQSR